MAAPIRILGIDPGLNTTGYAVIEVQPIGPRLVEAGVIKSQESRAAADMSLRLKAIYDGVIETIDQFRVTDLAVEQLYAHYDHPRTAILMGHARGVILLAGGQRNLKVASYASTQVKKAVTGSGRAGKEQMQLAMLREFQLKEMPEPHDVSDAMAIALCHYYQRDTPNKPKSAKLGTGIRMSAFDPDAEDTLTG
ncbi:MAG TPA: crossover junction endodeoxyribonuclease RuvC [Gemmataceae bacterium]|jgi:crossover junction endodeoxyribonuclease RuvC|nr:crossover junction endodeoxyribonuclease RuvC [Gemmataceae bacterium]